MLPRATGLREKIAERIAEALTQRHPKVRYEITPDSPHAAFVSSVPVQAHCRRISPNSSALCEA